MCCQCSGTCKLQNREPLHLVSVNPPHIIPQGKQNGRVWRHWDWCFCWMDWLDSLVLLEDTWSIPVPLQPFSHMLFTEQFIACMLSDNGPFSIVRNLSSILLYFLKTHWRTRSSFHLLDIFLQCFFSRSDWRTEERMLGINVLTIEKGLQYAMDFNLSC